MMSYLEEGILFSPLKVYTLPPYYDFFPRLKH